MELAKYELDLQKQQNSLLSIDLNGIDDYIKLNESFDSANIRRINNEIFFDDN